MCVWYVEIYLLGRLGRLEGLGACFLRVSKIISEICVRVLVYVETVVKINTSEGPCAIFTLVIVVLYCDCEYLVDVYITSEGHSHINAVVNGVSVYIVVMLWCI